VVGGGSVQFVDKLWWDDEVTNQQMLLAKKSTAVGQAAQV
jgi:hypothetical protein